MVDGDSSSSGSDGIGHVSRAARRCCCGTTEPTAVGSASSRVARSCRRTVARVARVSAADHVCFWIDARSVGRHADRGDDGRRRTRRRACCSGRSCRRSKFCMAASFLINTSNAENSSADQVGRTIGEARTRNATLAVEVRDGSMCRATIRGRLPCAVVVRMLCVRTAA